MSSYFVNQLTNCYPQESGGGGGESAREPYPQAHSPYHRGYNSASYPAYGSPSPGAATGHNGSDYYTGMNTQRLSHPPLQQGREKHNSPNNLTGGSAGGGLGTPADNAIGATNPNPNPRSQQNRSPDYQHQTSNTSTASSNYSTNSGNNNSNHHNNHMSSASSSGSQSGTEMTSMDSPPPQRTTSVSSPESSSPPAQQTQVPNSGGGGGGSGSEGDPTSPTQSPTSQPQIYPWMRRQHSGHGHGNFLLYLFLFHKKTTSLTFQTCKFALIYSRAGKLKSAKHSNGSFGRLSVDSLMQFNLV